jgi:hypothetical protein
MKNVSLVALIAIIVLVFAGSGIVQAHSGYSSTWDHLGEYGYTVDYKADLDSSCWSNTPRALSERMTGAKARDMIAWHLTRTNNRLKVDSVAETKDSFVVLIVTKNDEFLVDKLLVAKDTGRIYRVYQ